MRFLYNYLMSYRYIDHVIFLTKIRIFISIVVEIFYILLKIGLHLTYVLVVCSHQT
jgi:hypothetical protein